MAEQIGIPYYVVNFEQQFEEQVVKPFVDEYLAGRTPIPCTLCNNYIKFDRFLEMADSRGRAPHRHRPLRAHPLRRSRPAATSCCARVDDSKDQTYFLFGLTQEQLARTLFPLGELNKPEVRELARDMDLAVAAKGDSQEICFVPNGDYAAFMNAYLKEKGVEPRATHGEIVTAGGRTLGRARGRASFHRGPAQGPGHRGRRAAVRDRDRSARAQRVMVGGNDDLLCAPLRGQGGELDFDRRSRGRRHRAGPGEDPQQARGRAGHAVRHRRCRAAWKWSSTSRSAPSRPARARSSTTATWCWAAAGSNRIPKSDF